MSIESDKSLALFAVLLDVLLELGVVEPFEFVLAEEGPARHD